MKQLLIIAILIFVPIISFSQFPSLKNPYSIQMHLHGWSNHNGHAIPGSMQWHTFFADSTGTDVLWWSDHIKIHSQPNTTGFHFDTFYHDTINSVLASTISYSEWFPSKWVISSSNCENNFVLDTNSLEFILNRQDTSLPAFCSIAPRTATDKKLNQNFQTFIRSLSSEPVITFQVYPSGFDSTNNNFFELTIFLNFHHYYGQGQLQQLIYRFAPNYINQSYFVDSSTVVTEIQVTNAAANNISLNLLTAASMLRDGEDNIISDYQWKINIGTGANVSCKISNFKITSVQKTAIYNFSNMENFAGHYHQEYGVAEYIGGEQEVNNGNNHLNAFLPDTATDKHVLYDYASYPDALTYVNAVHNAAGIVSLNHPFGVSWVANNSQYAKIDSLALHYISVNGYNCDVMEVGYASRGGANFDSHCKLWDKLTANAVFMYGNGTSDMHGGIWHNETNHFVTWVWSEDSTTLNLINNIKSGLLYGGDNILFSGKFFFDVDSFPMGSRVNAIHDSALISATITSALPGSQFSFTQGLIQNGLNVSYLHYNEPFNITNPPAIDLTHACFVRILVSDSSGAPYLFSNPVVFLHGTQDSLTNIFENQQYSFISLMPGNNVQDLIVKGISSKDINKMLQIRVIDLSGKITRSAKYRIFMSDQKITLDTGSLANGIYICQGQLSGKTFARSFAVMHNYTDSDSDD